MATKSNIEWTGSTWNPSIGCNECSTGCLNCYAAKMAYRLMHIPAMAETYAGVAKKLPNGRIVFTGLVKELPDRLQEPYTTKKPTTWFVNSMSDLFHDDVSFNFLYKVFEIMLLTPHHTYQVLTKQPANAKKMMADVYFHLKRNYPDTKLPLANVWAGVSCENVKTLNERMFDHLSTDWAVHFLSYEPALEGIDLENVVAPSDPEEPEVIYTFNALAGGSCFTATYPEGETDTVDGPPLHALKWVICGGESGTGKLIRPMHPDWARNVLKQCQDNEVPFFFKQWGSYLPHCQSSPESQVRPVKFKSPNNPEKFNTYYKVGKHAAGALLDGKEWKEMPV